LDTQIKLLDTTLSSYVVKYPIFIE